MPYKFKEGPCPLCRISNNFTNQEKNSRELILKQGVSLIYEKLSLNLTSTTVTWDSTCDECYHHHIIQLLELCEVIKQTEIKIQDKLEWIKAQIDDEGVTGNT